MISFIKNSLILISLILVSCAKTNDTVEDTGLFFDVVYQVKATRENSNKAWVGVNGTMQVKISQYTDAEGTFIFFYNGYKEPQFVYNTCSGGIKGNFTVPDSTSTTTSSDSGYNVFTPYNPNTGSSTSDTSSTPTTITDSNGNTVTVDLIKTYNFQLAINYRNLDPACRQENDRNIVIYRFSNGELIMKNEYRDMLLKPVLTSDSQIQ